MRKLEFFVQSWPIAARAESDLDFVPYCTEIVATLLTAPPAVIFSAYCPAGSDGTTKFTWYKPAKPGASPANCSCPAAVPTVTETEAFVYAIDPDGAGAPLATCGDVVPSPVA